MDPAKLIEAKMKGTAFERILHAVKTDRETVSELAEDQVDFYESMLSEVRTAVDELEKSIREDDLSKIKKTSDSLIEIFTMIGDSCESS